MLQSKALVTLTALLSSVILLQGCSNAEKNLNAKLNQEPAPASPGALSEQAQQMIVASETMTPEQKQKLLDLRDQVAQKNQSLAQESEKLRSILIKDTLSAKFDRKELRLIRKKLQKIENQRLTNVFDAVDNAAKILGRDGTANAQAVERMFSDGSTRFSR